MARQTGIIQLSGPLGGISFYRHKKYGMLARACNPVSAQRIAKDPAFARTRENGTEFGMASRAGKLLRDGLHGFLRDVSTEELDLRAMRLMMELKAQDTVSSRGQRQVGVALGLQPGLLGGFEFNEACGLGRFLVRQSVVDVAQGTISLPVGAAYASPRGWLDHVPKQATHVVLTGFRGRIDFGNGEKDFVFSEGFELALDDPGQHVVLTLLKPRGETGIELWGMKIVFLQEVNGVRYTLKTGAASVLMSNAVHVVDDPEAALLREIREVLGGNRPDVPGESPGQKGSAAVNKGSAGRSTGQADQFQAGDG
jgi:hypothetical protein